MEFTKEKSGLRDFALLTKASTKVLMREIEQLLKSIYALNTDLCGKNEHSLTIGI